MKRNKILWVVLIILAVVAASYFLELHRRGKPSTPVEVQVGAVLPLTGSLAFFGEPERQVLAMALEEVNASGGVEGTSVTLLLEDSKSSARDGVSAVQKLLLAKPSAVITSLTIISNAAQPILASEKVAQIALSVHPTIARQSSYTIRPYYGFEDEMKVIAAYLREIGARRVAALWVQVPESEAAIQEVLLPLIQQEGGELVESQNYGYADTSVRAQLTKIAAADPDAIVSIDFGNMMGTILKEAETAGLREKLVGGIGFFSAPPIEASLLEGVRFAGPAFVIRSEPTYLDFSQRFSARTGNAPSYDVAYTYDAFNLLIKGLRQSSGKAGKELIDVIVGMGSHRGVTGNLVISSDGNVTVDISMGEFRAGQMVPLAVEEKR